MRGTRINDHQTQKNLLAEKALSFVKAMEIALAVESATKGARDITLRMCDNVPLHVVSDKTPQWLIILMLFHQL